MKVLITELHVKAACNSRTGIYLDLTAGMSQDYSMGSGLMANTFCYYLLNIEHVPLIRRTFQKSNRKTEPNVPKCFSVLVFPELFWNLHLSCLCRALCQPWSTWGFSWAPRGCLDLKPSVTVHRESHYHWASVLVLHEEAATKDSAFKGARY